jgi:Flp pilus assembly protein TadD
MSVMRKRVVAGASVVAALASCLVPAPATGQGTVTYDDVAPLLSENCVGCHRPGGLGPFSLTTYEEARTRAERIVEMAASRRMPPWLPLRGYGQSPFAQEPPLTDAGIETLRRWVAAGTPAGRARGSEAPAAGPDWPLGEPDLIVSMAEPYTVAAGSGVAYRNFALPVDIPAPRWVRAVDIRPNPAGRAAIQRAQVTLDDTGTGRRLQEEQDAGGYPGIAPDHGRFPPGDFLVWSGGRRTARGAEELAWQIDPGTDLLLQLGLRAREQPVDVQASVGLYWTDQAPATRSVGIVLDAPALDIPAGEPAHVVEDRYLLPVPVDVTGIYAYLHHLGKGVEVTAEVPDGSTLGLLHIDDWQFDWQDGYRFTEPVRLPTGTLLRARFTLDNSAANPRNPSTPPVRVRYNPDDTSPRAEVFLQAIPASPDDHAALVNNLSLKQARNDMLGLQAMLRVDPNDYRSHTDLAARYLTLGQLALARQHLDQALSLAPQHPTAHFNLGSLLVAEGDTAGAIDAFREAIAIRPEYPAAHNNLGALLAATGSLGDAIVYYRLALQFGSRDASAHYNLGNALLSTGSVEEAITHFREALTLTPDDPDVHTNLARALVAVNDLAGGVTHYQRALETNPQNPLALVGLSWLRAAAPDAALRSPSEALALVQQAVALIGMEHPEVLDTLAAAYAAVGRFDDALTTARQAADAARGTAFESRVPGIEARVRLYLTFRPYRMPSPAP